jgi:diguanylate cyclase (GGDEF)-like protein/PAS domain S-box-containing protein
MMNRVHVRPRDHGIRATRTARPEPERGREETASFPLERLFAQCADAISVHTGEGEVLFGNPAFARMLRRDATTLIGHDFLEFVHPEDAADVRAYLDTARVGLRSVDPIRYRIKQGRAWRTAESRITNLLDDRLVRGLLITTHDVTQAMLNERWIQYVSSHESVTGLLNRSGLCERIEHMLAVLDDGLAIIVVEVERFDAMIHTRGHSFGDQVLLALAQQIVARAPHAAVAHLGGATFAVTARYSGPDDDIRRIAEWVAAGLAEPVVLEGQRLFPSVSVGVATTRSSLTEPAELLRRGAAAARHARGSQGTRVEVFGSALEAEISKRTAIEHELHDAVAQGDFRLEFQPIVSLVEPRCHSAEALLRWGRSGIPLYGPADFVPVAEETGLIVPLGAWTIAEAMAARARFGRFGSFTLTVNLSPRQLLEPDLCRHIQEQLDANGLSPGDIAFEVTESLAVADVDLAARRLSEIRTLGCRVGMDDFGTGYSSLGYLRQLPVDFLKIDRAFIRMLGQDPGADALVRAIVAMARALEIQVVAEGVETELQHERLLVAGCTYAQGHRFAQAADSLPAVVDQARARLDELALEPLPGDLGLRAARLEITA